MQQKILIVTDFYKPHISGVVTYISQLVETYQKLNFSVTILTTLHDKNLKSEEVINNIKVIRCKPDFQSKLELVRKDMLSEPTSKCCPW